MEVNLGLMNCCTVNGKQLVNDT